jgi:hypothetical protein
MKNGVKISKEIEAVPGTGSYKVEYPGGVEYFYYDDVKSRRLRPDDMTSEQALAKAVAFARDKADEQARNEKRARSTSPDGL